MFKLIDTNRDGRVVRQTFAQNLGSAGCLVLISTTVFKFASVEGLPAPGYEKIEDMAEKCEVESMSESTEYVPGVHAGDKGFATFVMDDAPVDDNYGDDPDDT